MLNLTNLDDITRPRMRAEVEADIASGNLYESPRLSRNGRADYPALLLAATDHGTDESLAAQLATGGRLEQMETATRNAKTFPKKVPITAPQTLAEGEFNRFYARGLCLRAVDEGHGQVRVYRAKDVVSPRPQSEAMIGKLVNAHALLVDLRQSSGIEPALGLPPGPNSGLSVELPS